MGFLTDPKTNQCLTVKNLAKRETKEWGEALGTFAKEVFGAGKQAVRQTRLMSEDQAHEFLNSALNTKRRRR